jgi:hypothetical protein
MTNLRGQEEDEYLDKVTELSERLSGDDPGERIRQIAREEADKRLYAFFRAGPIHSGHMVGATAVWDGTRRPRLSSRTAGKSQSRSLKSSPK